MHGFWVPVRDSQSRVDAFFMDSLRIPEKGVISRMVKGMQKEKSAPNIPHLENSKVMCFMIVADLVSISTIRNRHHTVSSEIWELEA